ncbi:hypothetical protein N7541_008204 [Penicillium brevicompactum]|uniref:WD40 repeat-like protein n=1 Tax=Penicillium brevicompactum TaxID=5074 RepID=A0A9W9QYN1_PENBR|nr:hypothetical protein N7541_008204 [Penicillium brevicompactum]
MSHSIPASSQGMPPVFGLSAQSIPENPDTVEQTRRLLQQFSATPFITAKYETRRETPRSELPQSSRQAQQSSPRRFTRSPAEPPSHPQPSSARRSVPSSPIISPSASPSPSLRTSRTRSPLPPPPPTRGSRQQRPLRERVTITNANKSDEVTARISRSGSGSSTPPRSTSPVENTIIRRSHRSRAQPTNYYARSFIDFEEPEVNTPEVNTQEAPTLVSPPELRPQEPNHFKPRKPLQHFLRTRELGGRPINLDMISDLRPWKSWKGASGDMFVVIWSPDGTRFAAGAGALSDEYNEARNFVLGNVQTSRLKEIPDHRIPQPNASNIRDPWLYTSVTDMQWARDRLYTASYDKTVKVWDTTSSNNISCLGTLAHESKVELTAVPKFDSRIVATGSDVCSEVVRVWDTRDIENPTSTALSIDRPNVRLKAGALAWGTAPASQDILAAGMSQTGDDQNFKGYLGLWRACENRFEAIKASKNSQAVHDLTWHSSLPQFVTASPLNSHDARLKGVGTATKSLVSVFHVDMGDMRGKSIMEYTCPADDVNQVHFCPSDDRYVSASCTNGTTYVWDIRKGDKILHELRHGDPINPYDHDSTREKEDAGVKVAVWGLSTDQFYTGASDGVLKRWDIRRSSEDTLLQNVATFDHGLFSASFSPDKSHLLIGDSGGGVHILSSGPCADPENRDFIVDYAPEFPTAEPQDNTLEMDLAPEERSNSFSGPPPTRVDHKRKREGKTEEKQRVKLEVGDDTETDSGTRTNEQSLATNQKSGLKSSHAKDSPAEKKSRRSKKKRKLQPIIRNTEAVDLTLDSDSDTQSFDMEQLREKLEEDYWLPDSGSIDPNITVETV